MNRSLGWGAAALVAIATLFGITRQAGNNHASTVAQPANAVRESRKTAPSQKGKKGSAALDPALGCGPIEGTLQTFFLIPEVDSSKQANIQAPDECFADRENGSNPDTLPWRLAAGAHTMVALLPDPIHTQLAGTFDQLTEAIEHAAQAEGFNYDSSWLPWSEPGPAYMALSDNLRANTVRGAKEDQPGILLFRRSSTAPGDYSSALIVFVVGEQATAGINKTQFENAIAWMDWLAQDGNKNPSLDPLTILGPYSSGSFASIAQILRSGTPLAQSVKSLRIASGTASAQSSIQNFQTAMGSRLDWGRVVTFEENTTLAIQRYLRLLASEDYDLSRVAIVTEDQTSFGGLNNLMPTGSEKCKNETSSCAPGVILKYPRDISGLRGAYQKQGLLAPPSNQTQYQTGQRLLTEDLTDGEGGADDNIRSYSGTQADLSDEGELLQVALQLRERQIEYVLLVGSNPLDQMFLARFLRAADPSVRVVVVGSDQALFRGQSASDLRGVLAISSFPLSPAVEAWTTQADTKDKPIFTSGLAQGFYYAARFLLEAKPAAGDANGAAPLPGYAPPSWIEPVSDTCVPPTWLTAISAGRPWPVAALDERTLKLGKKHRIVPTEPASCALDAGGSASLLAPPRWLFSRMAEMPALAKNGSPSSVPIEFPLAVFACVLWALLHAWFRLNASVVLKPRCRAYFALNKWWAPCLVLNLSWACIGIAALSLFWFARYASEIAPEVEPYLFVLVAVVLICAVFPILDCFFCRKGSAKAIAGKDYPEGMKGQVSALLSLFVLLMFLAILWWRLPGYDEAVILPEQLRGLHLMSGVSPAMPFILLAIGGYLCCLKNLHCMALLNCDRPLLPSKQDLELTVANGLPCPKPESEDLKEFRSKVLVWFAGEDYDNPKLWNVPLGTALPRLFASFVALFLVIVWILQLHVRDLGVREYGDFFGVLILLLIALLVTHATQFLVLWFAQHELLGYLDRIPLRRTMRSIQDFCWNSIWTIGGAVLDSRYQMLSRQLESLRHFENAWAQHKAGEGGVPASKRVQESVDVLSTEIRCSFSPWYAKTHKMPGRIDLTYFGNVQRKIAALTGILFVEVLLPAWAAEKKSLIMGGAHGKANGEGNGAELLNESDAVRTAEEFVCLTYLAYIQNALGRMRGLVVGQGWLFLAATLASTAYPFDPKPMLSAVFLAVFVLLAGAMLFVFAQAHRDATLSNITNTEPGELGGAFYLKVLQFGIGPAIGLVSVLFPDLANFLFAWLQPGQLQ